MSKPTMNILRSNRPQSLFESLDQIGQGSRLEATQDRLDLRPGQFNRVEIWRVRRKINQVGTARTDQRFQSSDFVGRKIIHEQDIARLKSGHDTLFDIAIEHAA